MFRQPDVFTRGEFGMKCDEDFAKWRQWKIKSELRKNRYLYEPHNNDWEFNLNVHNVKRDGQVSITDNREPLVPAIHCLTNNRYHRRLANQIRYERENATLVKKIQQIFVGHDRKGGIENRLDPLTKSLRNPAVARQKKMLEIMLANCAQMKYINNAKPVISRKAQLEWYAEQVKHRNRASHFTYYKEGRLCAPFELVAQHKALEDPRPLCWMDIEVDQVMVGRLYFVLYMDICPLTAENFRSLCAGDRGRTYQCADLVSMVSKKIWIFGGLTKSIYGEPFPAENFKVKHNRPGILSMFRYGERTVSSQFLITGEACPILDGKHVAFGRVIKGMSFLRRIETGTKLSTSGKPRKRVFVSFCGQTNLKYLKRLPEPRFVDDIRDHIEANKKWQLQNPFQKLDKKYKMRKVKDWNKSESSDTFEEAQNKKGENPTTPYDAENEDEGEEPHPIAPAARRKSMKPPSTPSSAWSSQWSFQPPPPPPPKESPKKYRQYTPDSDEDRQFNVDGEAKKEEDKPNVVTSDQDAKDEGQGQRLSQSKPGSSSTVGGGARASIVSMAAGGKKEEEEPKSPDGEE